MPQARRQRAMARAMALMVTARVYAGFDGAFRPPPPFYGERSCRPRARIQPDEIFPSGKKRMMLMSSLLHAAADAYALPDPLISSVAAANRHATPFHAVHGDAIDVRHALRAATSFARGAKRACAHAPRARRSHARRCLRVRGVRRCAGDMVRVRVQAEVRAAHVTSTVRHGSRERGAEPMIRA